MVRLLILVFVLFSLTYPAAPAHASKRVALIIGNSAYEHASKLANPKNDANAIAEKLFRLDFDVVKGIDLTHVDFAQKVSAFRKKLIGADVGLFFYAGHGLQVDGENYLVPIDAELKDETSLSFETVPINTILKLMERATQTNLVFLDACRDNPLARNLALTMGTRSTSLGRGLARLETGLGTMISFATQPGNVALDGSGKNSPFTEAILKHIETPGLDVAQLMRRVRKDVIKKTSNRQVPWSNSSLTGDFYFASSVAPNELGTGSNSSNRLAASDESIAALRKRIEVLEKQKDSLKQTRIDVNEKDKIQTAGGIYPKKVKSDLGRALAPGAEFKECEKCPSVVVIPSGRFQMGSAPGEPRRDNDENPVREVKIARPFAASKFQVTFAEWGACVAEDGCRGHRPSDQGWGRENRPVINVSWLDAKNYVAWLSRKTNKTYRLLSEAEWEYAARAGTTTPFSTGRHIHTDQANYNGNFSYGGGKKGINRKKTVVVGSFPPNSFGLFDMHGNVWEWVDDCYSENYQRKPKNGTPLDLPNCDLRVVRGGSWINSPNYLRSASRVSFKPDLRSFDIGIRVARTIENAELTERPKPIEPDNDGRSEATKNKQTANLRTETSDRSSTVARLLDFVKNDYLGIGKKSHRISERHYAPKVHYYGKANVAKRSVMNEKARYYERWPYRTFVLPENTLQVTPNSSNRYNVKFEFEFDVARTGKSSSGRGEVVLTVSVSSDEITIYSESSRVLKRK